MPRATLLHALNKHPEAHILFLLEEKTPLALAIGAALAHDHLVFGFAALEQVRVCDEVCIRLAAQYNLKNLRILVSVSHDDTDIAHDLAQKYLHLGWNAIVCADTSNMSDVIESEGLSVCFCVGESSWSNVNERLHSYNNQCVSYVHDLLLKYKQDFFVNRPYESTACTAKNMLGHLFNKTQNYFSFSAEYPGFKLFNNIVALGQDKLSFFDMWAIYMCVVEGFSQLKPCVLEASIGNLGLLANGVEMLSAQHSAVVHCVVCDDEMKRETIELHTLLADLERSGNVHVFRPADALETIECLECALSLYNGHAIVVLNSRPSVSMRFCGRKNLCAGGAYILMDDHLYDESVTLVASGSVLSLALYTKTLLNKENVSVRIVSMPCERLAQKNDITFTEDSSLGAYKLHNGVECNADTRVYGLIYHGVDMNNLDMSASCLVNSILKNVRSHDRSLQ